MIRGRAGLAIAVWASSAGVLLSQGYSALRAPKESVFASFPEADGYRAIVRPVDKKIRAEGQERLPFQIHFNELGDHTVYAALRGDEGSRISTAEAGSTDASRIALELLTIVDETKESGAK